MGKIIDFVSIGSKAVKEKEFKRRKKVEKSVEERVVELVVDQLGVKKEEVIPKASFLGDLGADSLDTVELVIAFGDEFEIDIPDEDAEKITTVGAAIEYIKKAKGF